MHKVGLGFGAFAFAALKRVRSSSAVTHTDLTFLQGIKPNSAHSGKWSLT